MLVTMAAFLALTQEPTPFTLELAASPETEQGKMELARHLVELCQGKYPILGRYSFASTSAVEAPENERRFTFRGEVECVDSPPEPPPGVPVPSDWQATAADEERARAATAAYFAAIDRGDIASLEAMMSPGHRSTSTTADRAQAVRAFRSTSGAPGEHRIIRTTWYANPAGVAPGAYVAVDFDRRYEKLSVSCGFAAWHRQPDGRLLLVREETGNAPREPGQTAEKILEIRQLLRCRD